MEIKEYCKNIIKIRGFECCEQPSGYCPYQSLNRVMDQEKYYSICFVKQLMGDNVENE